MIIIEANIILGYTIDTSVYLKELKKQNKRYIFVVDYFYNGKPKIIDGVVYLSNNEMHLHLDGFSTIFFYKSLYRYPI